MIEDQPGSTPGGLPSKRGPSAFILAPLIELSSASPCGRSLPCFLYDSSFRLVGGTKGQVDGNKMHRYLNVKHEGRRCENKMAYYDRASMVPSTRPCELDPSILQMYHTFGMDASRKANLEYLDEESSEPVVAYVAGNALTLLHVPSMKRQYVFGLAKSGIGSFVVHPSRETFAVGEKGKLPNVYIYEYPTLNIVKVLRNGATRGYACMCYSDNGQKLATVSSTPDFMLSIWDWNNEQMLLQSKVRFGSIS